MVGSRATSRGRAVLLAAVALGAGAVAPVVAAGSTPYPGRLDPTFGHAGIASRTYAGQAASADFLLPSAAGTVVVGETETTTSNDGGIVVTRIGESGAFDPSYGSLTPSKGAAWAPAGAVIEPSGRLVVAANGTPGDSYPERIALFGFDPNGRVDPSFGAAGELLLTEPGAAVKLFIGLDGDLHVAGATVAPDSSLETGLLSASISQDGHELNAHALPIAGGDADVTAATPLPDGDVLVAGVNPDSGAGAARVFLTRLMPDGTVDPSFGTNGTLRPGLENARVDDVAVDNSGRMLLAGAYIGNLGRSVDVPVNGLLVRFNPDGTTDRSFAGGGAPNAGAFEFSGVTELPDHSLLVVAGGHLAHLSASGEPDLSFGDGGRAPAGALSVHGPAEVDGSDVLMPGLLFPAHGYDNALAVSRLTLTGTGIPPVVARSTIRVTPRHGRVGIRVQLASRLQRLTAPTDALLVPRTTDIGDGSRYSPYAARVRANSGEVALTGVRAHATVAHGTFGLRSVAHRVAALDFSSPGCGKHTAVQLTGPFMVTAGTEGAINRSHTARVRIGWPCRGTPSIRVVGGQMTIARFRGQPKPGTWF